MRVMEHAAKYSEHRPGENISFWYEGRLETREILEVTNGEGGLLYVVDPPDGFFCAVPASQVVEQA